MGNGESTCGLALVYLDKGEGVKKLIASFNSACQLWLEAILFICIFFFFSPFFPMLGQIKTKSLSSAFPHVFSERKGHIRSDDLFCIQVFENVCFYSVID